MITYSNKIEDRNYLHHKSVTAICSQPRRLEIGSGSLYPGKSTTAERKAENTVLVVNDMPDQLEMMSVLLRQAGYNVLTAFDGQEGFEVAQAEHPYLVISDVAMPRMDGIEMCRLMHEHPELSETPVLLVSANRKDRESVVAGLKAGADDYLEAPYDPMRLITKVARLIERSRVEGRLQESERRFCQLAENINEVFWVADLDEGAMLYVSPAYKEIWGRTCESLYEQPDSYLESVHPEDQNKMREAHERQRRGIRTDDEYRIVRPDGSIRWVHDRAFPIKDEAGRVSRIAGIAEDITKRKRAEGALRESEERYRLLFESNPLPMWVYDLETLAFLAVNDAAIHHYGYSSDEFLSMTIKDIRPREDIPALLEHVSKVSGTLDKAGVWRHRRKDGSVIDVEVVSHELVFAGTRAELVLANDVTERGRVEVKLRKSEERYRDLVENAHDIIYTHELEGNYVSINKAVELITGYSREEALRMNLAQIVAPEYLEKAREMIARKLAGERVTAYELELIAKDGHRVMIEVNTRLVYQDDIPVCVQGVARDVTERKQLEEQLRQSQKLEAVGQLAGGIAHDFNNLLTVINGYSDLTIRRIKTEDPLHRNIEEIKKAGERAASLTRQLLAFSRKQVLQPKVLDLNALVSDFGKMLQRLIGEDIELRTVLDPTLGSIKADPGQTEQVIMNLVVNARDAMPEGGKLTIETANVYLDEEYATHHIAVKPGPYVVLAVTDTGTGMDEKTRARIFEPFFTTKEAGKGTGLGLSTVYGIVKQSGGNIWVYSEVGRGTSFKIYLPRVDQGAQEYKRSADNEEDIQGTETILLAEDDEMVRSLIREVLEGYGYQVLEAANGSVASLICERHQGPIHLLLTDVVMPEMGGRELVDRLAQLRPVMRVLYMSGYTDEAIVHHGILDEGTNFIQKPFAAQALAHKVREVLGKYELEDGDDLDQ